MSIPNGDILSLYSANPGAASRALSVSNVMVDWKNRHIYVDGTDSGQSIDDVAQAVLIKNSYGEDDLQISEKLRELYKKDPHLQEAGNKTQEFMWELSRVSCEIHNQLQDRLEAEGAKKRSVFGFLKKIFSRKEDPEVMTSRSEDLGSSQIAEEKKTAFLRSLESSSSVEIDSFIGSWARMKCKEIASKSKQPAETLITFPDSTTLTVQKETLDSVQRGIPSQLSGAVDQYDSLSERVKENFSREQIKRAVEIVAESRKELHGKEKLTATELETDLESALREYDALSEESKALYSREEIKELNKMLSKIIDKRSAGESVDEEEFSRTFDKYKDLYTGIKRLYLLEKTESSKGNLELLLTDESKKGEFYALYIKEAIDQDFESAIPSSYDTIGHVFLMDLVDKLGSTRENSMNEVLFFLDQSYVGEISNAIVSQLGSQVKVKVNSCERQVSIPSDPNEPIKLELVMDFAKEYISTSGEELDLDAAKREFPFGIRATVTVELGSVGQGAVSYRMQAEKVDVPTIKKDSNLYPIICEPASPEIV